jgi:3-hydroxyacyl-CoA dehydrogenase/enoyl-CoA hydratase/3-hydroxybutyryl-CoA epimerase
MNQFNHLRIDRDGRSVVTVTFDVAQRSVNVLDEGVLGELDAAISRLERDRTIRLIVFRGAKPSGFLAGADVHRIHSLSNSDEVETAIRRGQDLFQRIEALPAPTLAVIHGPCLGGGLEFALSCTWRVARDEPATRIGLPETQLGLIPAWGGCQRLPHTVGVTAAVRMILEGSRLTAAKARKLGLIDAAFQPATFDEDLTKFIDAHLDARQSTSAERPRQAQGWIARLRDGTSLGRRLVLHFARRHIARQAKHYPALPAALRTIEAGLRGGMDAGLEKEREEFRRLLFTPACRNLLELFLQRERARKRNTWVADAVDSGPPIETIAVLGAGTMGAGIAQLAATHGYRVILKDMNDELVQQGMQRITKLTHDAVEKGALSSDEAEHALASVKSTTELSPLAETDLVIEAIVERLDIKEQVFHELDEHTPLHALLASNTSALPISRMAAATARGDQVAGLHFFNPVHKMPLVEIVRCPDSSDRTVATLVDVVRRLGKTPIVVSEGPGFLVNRILFPYLDEAVRLVGEGIPVEQIDREAKRFGFPMGPLELLDTIGLDIALDVSRSFAALLPEASPTPERLGQMVAAGDKGQKSGRGFYHYRNGRRSKPAVHGAAPQSAGTLPPPRNFAGETLSGIQQRLVFALINAASGALAAGIVTEPWMVDLGIVLGTGFAPFRGGPLKLAESWGRENVRATLEELSHQCGPRFHPVECGDSSPLCSREMHEAY